jgi:hypothetical protein
LRDPAFPPAGDALARLRRVQVERQEEKPEVDRHGDPLSRTHADKQSAVTLLASGIGCQMKYLDSTPVGAAQLGAAS